MENQISKDDNGFYDFAEERLNSSQKLSGILMTGLSKININNSSKAMLVAENKSKTERELNKFT